MRGSNNWFQYLSPGQPLYWNTAGLEFVEEVMCEIRRIVRKVNTADEFFFKSGHKRHRFQREVEVLAKLQKISEHNLSIRTSRIVGLVNWDGQESFLMCVLLERIDGITLYDAMIDASVAERRRWIDQVDEIVKRLYKYEIVWGDVKPDNVMISPSRDAILINFSGVYARVCRDRTLGDQRRRLAGSEESKIKAVILMSRS